VLVSFTRRQRSTHVGAGAFWLTLVLHVCSCSVHSDLLLVGCLERTLSHRLTTHWQPAAPPHPRPRPAPADGLIEFLVKEKTFAEDRIRKAIDRINAAKGKASQGRLESFFGPAKIVSSTTGKRKEAEKGKGKAAPAAKKGKLGALNKNKKK